MVQAGVLEAHNQDKQNATFSLGLSPWQRRCVHFRTNPDRNLTGEHRVYFCSRTVSYSGENQKSWENPPLRGNLLSTLQILVHLTLFVFHMKDSEQLCCSWFFLVFLISHQRTVMQEAAGEGEEENVNPHFTVFLSVNFT